MGIWIRSQDGKSIVECNDIRTDIQQNSCNIIANYMSSINGDVWEELGNYSNENKAVKVLDMLQNQMAKAVEAKTKYLPYSKGSEWSSCEHVSIIVFNMPLDDEVKV